MSSEDRQILPFWELSQYTLKNNYRLLRTEVQNASNYILEEFNKTKGKGFGNIKRTFWGLLAAYYLYNADLSNFKEIGDYIFHFRSSSGGFFSEKSNAPNIFSTFFAICSLRILGLNLNEDEKQITTKFILQNQKLEGFSHCNDRKCKVCGGKATAEATFYAIASLHLLNKISELDFSFATKYLSKKLPKNDIKNIFIILSNFFLERSTRSIDENISYLMELKREDGSFSEKTEGGDLQNTFWVVSCLRAVKSLNLINKGIIYNKFIKNLERESGGYNKDPLNTESNLIDTAQAVAINSLLVPELSEQIENNILQAINEEKEIFLKNIADVNFVDEKFVIKILEKMMEYKWFSVDLIKYKDVLDTYLNKLGVNEKKIAGKIIAKLEKNPNSTIDLEDFAKSLKIQVSRGSSYLPSEEIVKNTISKLIENKFVVGELEETKKLLKKSTNLKLQFIPDYVLVRKEKFNYEEIIKEKENFHNVDTQVNEIIDEALKIPEEFEAEIKNLLDIDEVELARGKIEPSFKQSMSSLEDNRQSINSLKSSFKYFDTTNLDSFQKWLKVSQNLEAEILDTKNKLEQNITEKENLITAYNRLNELVDFVDVNIKKFNEDLDNLNSFFIDTCRLHSLDKKKQDILVKVSTLEDTIKKIAEEIQERSNEISHITDKVKFLKNIIVSEDLSVSKRIATYKLKDKLEPFENWLENQWNQKRGRTNRKLEDIRSKIYKRDELINTIEAKKKTFKTKLDKIPSQIQQYLKESDYNQAYEKLNTSIDDILKFLSDFTQYIQDFIIDTNKLLDDFKLVAEDIPIEWQESMEQMRKELEDTKSELMKQIVSEQEIKNKDQIDEWIDKSIDDVSKKLTEISELSKINYEKLKITMKDLIKDKIKEIKIYSDNENDKITTFIKSTSKTYPTFQETINISMHKWKTFLNSLPTVFNQVNDQTIEDFTVKVTKALSKLENGGRVKLESLVKILGLSLNQVKNLLEKLISISKLEAELEDGLVIPLYAETKMQLEFEKVLNQSQEDLDLTYSKFSNFFIAVYEKTQIDNNESEIRERIKDFKNNINKCDAELKIKYAQQIKNSYNKPLMQNWENRKKELISEIDKITRTLNIRNEYKDSFSEKIDGFNAKVDEISNKIIEKIQDKKELPKLLEKLNTRVENLKDEIIKQRNIIKTDINEHVKHMEQFDKIVADVYANFVIKSEKILSDLKNLNKKLEEKIFEKQKELAKEILAEKIKTHNDQLKELVDVMEKEVYNIIQTGNLSEASTALKQLYNENLNYIKTSSNSISDFIKTTSKVHRNFKDFCILVLRDWNPVQLESVLDKAFNILQDRIIIRDIGFAQRAFHGNRVNINELSSRVSIKTKIFRERLIEILGTTEELKGKLDHLTNEYIFRPEEEPKAGLPAISLSAVKKKSIPDAARDLYPFFAIISMIGGTLTAAVYTLTRDIVLTVLVPSIGIPLAFITLVIYYRLTNKRAKKGQ